jgi:hypothetical protein
MVPLAVHVFGHGRDGLGQGGLERVDQRDLVAGEQAGMGDAVAHQPGADDADTFYIHHSPIHTGKSLVAEITNYPDSPARGNALRFTLYG